MKISENPRLDKALGEYFTSTPNQRMGIEDHIWKTFGQQRAVVVIDMANFSLITHQKGIVYFLTLIQQMQLIVQQESAKHGGLVIKFLADNAFLVFDDSKSAVDCLLQINRRLRQYNLDTTQIWDVEICAGVCFGNILNINNKDIFGEAVNTAARLGEDMAHAYEILLSDKAAEQLSQAYLTQHQAEKCFSDKLQRHYYGIKCA